MRVGTTEINIDNLINQIKARNMPKRVRPPNCTHVDMDRLYGRDQLCCVCGREPSIGFLYQCKQDSDTQSIHDMLEQENDCQIEVAKSDRRLQLEWAGLSESIILTAERGHYTEKQLQKLKAQKHELRQIISDQLQASQTNDAAAKLAAMAQTLSNHDGAFSSLLTKDANPPACAFKACHTCRPYYRDRVYISFQSVLSADFPPVTRDDLKLLPTKSAQIMKSIGSATNTFPSLPTEVSTPLSMPTSTSLAASTDAPHTASTSTSTSSDLTFDTTQTDLDEISAQRRPRRQFYKMGHRTAGDISRDLSRQSARISRQGLKTAIQGIFRPNRESSSEGSNITLPLPRTGTVCDSNNSQDIGEFDLSALRKVRREKERNEVKNGTYVAGFEGVHANASGTPTAFAPCSPDDTQSTLEASSSGSDSDFSVYSCVSEGSEVEVDGGIALTEEAVETHTPDILAVHVSTAKNAVVVRAVELQDDDDDVDEADIGLQCIMTQV